MTTLEDLFDDGKTEYIFDARLRGKGGYKNFTIEARKNSQKNPNVNERVRQAIEWIQQVVRNGNDLVDDNGFTFTVNRKADIGELEKKLSGVMTELVEAVSLVFLK